MVRRQTLKKIGGSVATVLPKSMLDRFHLDAGDDVYVVETDKGLLITPFDPDFEEAMEIYARGGYITEGLASAREMRAVAHTQRARTRTSQEIGFDPVDSDVRGRAL